MSRNFTRTDGTYKETYVATSTMPTFTFTVIPGEIRAEELYTDSGITPLPAMLDMFARYEIDIRMNGSSIWDSSGHVQLMNSGTSSSFSGTSIGGTLNTTASSNTYAWATPFTDTITLGTFASGTQPPILENPKPRPGNRRLAESRRAFKMFTAE